MVALSALEGDLAELRAAYEQYFMGNERLPPLKKHEGFKKLYLKMKGSSVRQTAVKFRLESIGQKLLTYERLWERTLKDIENGTYKRDLLRARRQQQRRAPTGSRDADFDVDEDVDLSEEAEGDLSSIIAAAEQAVDALAAKRAEAPPSVAPSGVRAAPPPVTPSGVRPVMAVTPAAVAKVAPPMKPVTAPVAAAPRPAGDGGLSEQKIKAIYDAYVMAKKRCGEDTRAVTLDAVASSLKKQVPALMKQHNAKSVEFKVVIKDGKAILRALPRE